MLSEETGSLWSQVEEEIWGVRETTRCRIQFLSIIMKGATRKWSNVTFESLPSTPVLMNVFIKPRNSVISSRLDVYTQLNSQFHLLLLTLSFVWLVSYPCSYWLLMSFSTFFNILSHLLSEIPLLFLSFFFLFSSCCFSL